MQKPPYIDIHTHHSNRKESVISIVNYFPEQIKLEDLSSKIVSVGLHPWHLNKDCEDENIDLIRTIASINKVLAIGEIGLDRNIAIPLGIQKAYFTKQVAIAEKFNKPIIIHCVRCFPELISIKKKIKASTPWLIHGFRNNIQIAQNLLKQDCYISFGEALLFDKKIQNVFVEIPINQIFLETDESKHSIIDIYNKAAQLKGLQLDDFKMKLFENYKSVFQTK
ncbi:TatD family hydrolase [Ancylomarina sp.]|uniref:TatD family hydrolase n=1 Tax=Ancylomarina sp. TaxID=1970196 RepID=UPI00356431DA